jgi:hypothetical protein
MEINSSCVLEKSLRSVAPNIPAGRDLSDKVGSLLAGVGSGC